MITPTILYPNSAPLRPRSPRNLALTIHLLKQHADIAVEVLDHEPKPFVIGHVGSAVIGDHGCDVVAVEEAAVEESGSRGRRGMLKFGKVG